MEVICGSFARGVIVDDAFAKTWGLAQFDVSLNYGFKNHVVEVFLDFFHHLIGQTQSGVIHGQKQSFYIQIGIVDFLDAFYGVQ